ncbi:MAG: 30S ribosomal protein S9 [Candidatus Aenigmarchaeota archaeon]|nr:30S ribosomal protein S9 [Candidatus Aenigmarchaeota archaeon]
MKKKKPVKEEKKLITTGKRKRAVARACFTKGKGAVKINKIPLEKVGNEMARMKMQEPLTIAGDCWKSFSISVTVKGGGQMGQADAARQAISRGLVELFPETKEMFLKYDRFLLAYDPRRTETHKPPHSSWGARRMKQKSKR